MPLLATRSLYEAGAVSVNLIGVSGSAAIGTLRFNVKTPIIGVAASPVIGTGTVITAGAGAVIVTLQGVAANPRIGVGTVEIEITLVYGITEPVRVRRAKPKPKPDIFIYVDGVEAKPRIGRFLTPVNAKIFGIAAGLPAVGELTANVGVPVDGISTSAAIGSLIVVTDLPLTGVQCEAAIGGGTVKTIIDLFPEEILALLEAA